MCSVPDNYVSINYPPPDLEEEFGQDFLSYIRSRLNVICTSMYLLEDSLLEENLVQKKYIDKINQELEAIRKLING
ncbi:MAG: hypothetical protein GWN62_30710 [Aliifodinibius sp.]|nr:hypothetical protein [Fodinibius sp.]